MTMILSFPDLEARYRWDMISPITRANALYLGLPQGRISFQGILTSGFFLVQNLQPGHRPSWFNAVISDMIWAAAETHNDELYALLSKLDEIADVK